MTISILICTIDEGIEKVPDVLMAPSAAISYVVSMQYTDAAYLDLVPEVLREREDVTLTTIEGRGLSRNRNNAIAHAKGEVMVIADDDNRYTMEFVDSIREAYNNAEADIIHFQAQTLDGEPLHDYPADFVSSVEMTFRREVKIRFNERFGLGSEVLCSGEEQVWMKDAKDVGYRIEYVAKPIVRTPAVTTGSRFVDSPKMQMSKGAAFCYVYGRGDAVWRSVKEAGWWFVHRGANPFAILRNMLKGVSYVTCKK